MYEKFFGLSEKPFQQIPDPDYYFPSRVHKSARSYLDFGLHQGEGFIVITGEIGSGKTTLLRTLLRKIHGGPYVIAHLVSTNLDHEELLRLIALEFGLDTQGARKADLLIALRNFFVQSRNDGRRVLLVIDEAQNLPASALEELRMMANFDDGNQTPMQCLLMGQAELRNTLRTPQMSRLRQRIGAAYHLSGMDADDVGHYIAHRLERAGGTADNPAFSAEANEALHAASMGIPRALNLLCDRLLITAYLDELKTIGKSDVETAIEEMSAEFARIATATDAHASDDAVSGNEIVAASAAPAASVWAEREVIEFQNRLVNLEQSNVEIRKGMGVLVREMRKLVESRRRERQRQRQQAASRSPS